MSRRRPLLSLALVTSALLVVALLLPTLPGALADEPLEVVRLKAALEDRDAEAVAAALEAVADALGTTTAEEPRTALLEVLGYALLEERIPAAQESALRVIRAHAKGQEAWHAFRGTLPLSGAEEVPEFELRLIDMVGDLGLKGGIKTLTSLVRNAACPGVVLRAVRALGGFHKAPDVRDGVLETLMQLAEEAREADAGEDEEGPDVEFLRSALADALRRLTGLTLEFDAFLEQWAARGRDPLKMFAVPSGVTNALTAPDTPACLAQLERLLVRRVFGRELPAMLESVVLTSKDWRERALALRVLAWQEPPGALPKLFPRLVKEKRWQVRLALAEALPAYLHLESLDLLIVLLGDKRTRVRDAAARGLSALTTQDHGTNQKAWQAWRNQNKDHIVFVPLSARPERPVAGHRYAQQNRFFGKHITSDRVVLVLDKSDSMYWGLFDKVVEEVGCLLDTALPTLKFAVIQFDETPRIWRKKLSPAHAGAGEEVRAFLTAKKPYGPTNIIDSLRMAMAIEDVDSVVLLSDGLPNRGEPCETGAILDEVRAGNLHTRVAIHTLLMMDGRAFPHDSDPEILNTPLDEAERNRRAGVRAAAPGTELGGFMSDLAAQNDGTFDVVFADYIAPENSEGTRPNTDE